MLHDDCWGILRLQSLGLGSSKSVSRHQTPTECKLLQVSTPRNEKEKHLKCFTSFVKKKKKVLVALLLRAWILNTKRGWGVVLMTP